LQECDTWPLSLRKKHRLRMFEDGVLRRIFGPKREKVTGGWRKLCIEELHDLFCTPIISGGIRSRKLRWVGHVAPMEVMRMHTKLVRKLEGKRPVEKPRCKWEDNIKVDLKEMGSEDVDWMHLAQDRDKWWASVNMVMNIWVPKEAENLTI